MDVMELANLYTSVMEHISFRIATIRLRILHEILVFKCYRGINCLIS